MRSEEHKINYQKGLSVYNQIVHASYMPQFLQVIGHCIRQFQEKKIVEEEEMLAQSLETFWIATVYAAS